MMMTIKFNFFDETKKTWYTETFNQFLKNAGNFIVNIEAALSKINVYLECVLKNFFIIQIICDKCLEVKKVFLFFVFVN